MTFTKIKYNLKKSKVELAWTTGEGEEHTLKHTEPPRPAFWEALQACKALVVSMCMLQDQEHLLTIRSVTLKYTDENSTSGASRGIVITALRELDWIDTPQVVNTPFASLTLIPAPLGEDGEISDFETGILEPLDTLEAEAAAYVRGERAQSDLFEATEEFSDNMQRMTDESGTSMSIEYQGEEVAAWTPQQAQA